MKQYYRFKDLDLYHKDVFLTPELSEFLLKQPPRYLRLTYSKVAGERAEKDRVPTLDWITLRPENVIEVGCIPGTDEIDTIVVREPFSAQKDLLLSIAVDFQKGAAIVKMAWTHTPGKAHFAIRKSDYIQKPDCFNTVFNEELEVAI